MLTFVTITVTVKILNWSLMRFMTKCHVKLVEKSLSNHKQVHKTIKCESCGESFNYKAYYSIELEFCPGKL